MILPVMCSCVVLTIATVAAINVSIPQIETSTLHPSNTQLVWIVDVYVIVFASLLFPAGAIAIITETFESALGESLALARRHKERRR
jgi:hypothetical protein